MAQRQPYCVAPLEAWRLSIYRAIMFGEQAIKLYYFPHEWTHVIYQVPTVDTTMR